jgi:hypothetical protein
VEEGARGGDQVAEADVGDDPAVPKRAACLWVRPACVREGGGGGGRVTARRRASRSRLVSEAQ